MLRFKNEKDLFNGRNQALEYLKRTKKGDLSAPEKLGLRYLSQVIDEAAQRVFEELSGELRQSNSHKNRVGVLLAHEPKCSKKERKNILGDSSSFEQMVALKEASVGFEEKKKRRFQFVANEGDYVPVTAQGPDLFLTVLGDTKGAHKGPAYTDWAKESSQSIAEQIKLFLFPLEALEIARQIDFTGAILLKGNAYDAGIIDGEHRFGLEYASVEEKQQRRSTVLGHSGRKLQSAGLNLVGLTKKVSSPTKSICPVVRYEDYASENYQDDLVVEVSTKELIEAIEHKIVEKDCAPLDHLMLQLFMTKIGPQNTPCLRDPIAQKIFQEPIRI